MSFQFNKTTSMLLTFLFSLHVAAGTPMKSKVEAHVLRLGPDEDPKVVLMNYVIEKKISAASIVSVVGSLKITAIRYANQNKLVRLEGFREVVSMSGTLGASSGSHLHLSVADGQGITLGGHLMEGSKVYTTLEVVLLAYPELEFARLVDPKTTYQELSIKNHTKK
jgi:uncharacterized protein